MGIFACALIVGSASFAVAGVPDLDLSSTVHYTGAGTPVLYNLPSGTGSAFTEARIVSSPPTVVDATITLTVLDGGSIPVANFPAEDMWLETTDLVQEFPFIACVGGTSADQNTDEFGVTMWAQPIRAGGASQALTFVIINGAALTGEGGLSLSHNSADLNADGAVNLLDVPKFAGDLNGLLHPFRSDFNVDGLVNLLDVPKLAGGLGTACP
jgi:hypothetical protein